MTIWIHSPNCPPCSVLRKPAFNNGFLGPWFTFGFSQWRVPEKIRGWEKKEAVVSNPLASLCGVPELKATTPAKTLSIQPLPSLGSDDCCLLSPFRLRGTIRCPPPSLGATLSLVHFAHIFINIPFIELSSDYPTRRCHLFLGLTLTYTLFLPRP